MFWSSPNFSAFGSGYQTLVDKYKKKYNVTSVQAPFHAHSYDANEHDPCRVAETRRYGARCRWNIARAEASTTRCGCRDQGFQGYHRQSDLRSERRLRRSKIAIYLGTADNFAKLNMPDKPVWAPGVQITSPNQSPTTDSCYVVQGEPERADRSGSSSNSCRRVRMDKGPSFFRTSDLNRHRHCISSVARFLALVIIGTFSTLFITRRYDSRDWFNFTVFGIALGGIYAVIAIGTRWSTASCA